MTLSTALGEIARALVNPVVYSLIRVAIILAVFIPLSVRQFNKAAAR